MLKPLFIGSLGLTVLLAGSLEVARLSLPTTSCSVTESQIDGLALSKISYADVSRLFGCQGELSSREDLGKIVFEKYQWRGAAWPFGNLKEPSSTANWMRHRKSGWSSAFTLKKPELDQGAPAGPSTRDT